MTFSYIVVPLFSKIPTPPLVTFLKLSSLLLRHTYCAPPSRQKTNIARSYSFHYWDKELIGKPHQEEPRQGCNHSYRKISWDQWQFCSQQIFSRHHPFPPLDSWLEKDLMVTCQRSGFLVTKGAGGTAYSLSPGPSGCALCEHPEPIWKSEFLWPTMIRHCC